MPSLAERFAALPAWVQAYLLSHGETYLAPNGGPTYYVRMDVHGVCAEPRHNPSAREWIVMPNGLCSPGIHLGEMHMRAAEAIAHHWARQAEAGAGGEADA